MTIPKKPRLRSFETAANQQHIPEGDKYLYSKHAPTHKLVVIGTGTIGQEHMRVAATLGRASIHGIFDSSSQSLDAAESGYREYSSEGLVRYSDLESACMDPEADALFICTPNFTHFDILQVALKSGKAIFLEKPMATSLADAGKIVEQASHYSSFLQIGLQYRYKAQYVEAFQEVLERRSLGSIKTISMSEYRPPFLDKVGQWNKFNAYSGGTLVEKCCHYFDLINLLAESTPLRVFASGGQAVNFLDFEKDGKKSDIDDHGFVTIDYKSGVRATFTLNMFCPDFYEELVVCGDGGRLLASERVDLQRGKEPDASIAVYLGEQGASRTSKLGYPQAIEQSGHHGATFYEHIAFLDRLEGKTTDGATPLQGLWAMIVASAAQESIASGMPINIPDYIDRHELSGALTV
ncbi:MAG: putative oxidoreductase YrbE [Pseudohongiella sp.]|nr:MAG: putative oxidoreductase YrbE [Pseudohongiella sp.]